MLTVSQIIEDLGGSTEFGKICGFEVNPAARGSDMRRRNSIPPEYWPCIANAAKNKRKRHITLASLAQVHVAEKAKRLAPSPTTTTAEAR